MIVAAQPLDAITLTEIAFQSKAYWGYSPGQIERWRLELTVTPSMFEDAVIYKYLIGTEIAGFYILENWQFSIASLAFLFVSPEFIKQGVGKQLVAHAIQYSRKNKCSVL
jgi:GNAT superfamily N-acetyltransferase